MPNVVCYKSCCTSPHRNGRLWTPLDQAADKGYADIIALLLEADAPLEAKDKSSVSVLIVCRKHARTYVCCNNVQTAVDISHMKFLVNDA